MLGLLVGTNDDAAGHQAIILTYMLGLAVAGLIVYAF